MPRHKSAEKCTILPWLSAEPGGKEKSFIQVGLSLFKNEKYKTLTPSTQHLFLCMVFESRGKREFTFPQHKALEYGITPITLRRAVESLIENQIIELKSSGKNTRMANIYSFRPDAFMVSK